MGLLAKLKSVLGLNGTGSGSSGRGSRGDVDVTVERQPATGSESAVKGTDAGSDEEWFDDESDAAEASAGTGEVVQEAEGDVDDGSGGDGTSSLGKAEPVTPSPGETDDETGDDAPVEDESADEELEESAEETGADDAAESESPAAESAAEAAEGSVAEATEESAAETADDSAAEVADDSAGDDAVDQGSTDPVTEITGIGPAYGERLENAGVETVAELAASDAAELSEETDVAKGRVEGWVESAQEY